MPKSEKIKKHDYIKYNYTHGLFVILAYSSSFSLCFNNLLAKKFNLYNINMQTAKVGTDIITFYIITLLILHKHSELKNSSSHSYI